MRRTSWTFFITTLTLRFSILSRSHAFIELRANIFGQPVTVVDEPELTAIGAALIAAQGAGVALPFGEGLNLQQIQPVASWVEPYTRLYKDYRARLDAASEKAMNSTRSRQ